MGGGEKRQQDVPTRPLSFINRDWGVPSSLTSASWGQVKCSSGHLMQDLMWHSHPTRTLAKNYRLAWAGCRNVLWVQWYLQNQLKEGYPTKRPYRPVGLWDVEDSALSSQSAHRGRQVVSPTHRPHSTPQKRYFSASGTHFCWRLSKPQRLVRPEGLGKLKKCIQRKVGNAHKYIYLMSADCSNYISTVKMEAVPAPKFKCTSTRLHGTIPVSYTFAELQSLRVTRMINVKGWGRTLPVVSYYANASPKEYHENRCLRYPILRQRIDPSTSQKGGGSLTARQMLGSGVTDCDRSSSSSSSVRPQGDSVAMQQVMSLSTQITAVPMLPFASVSRDWPELIFR
jgi:hypothetical protein